jgi:hypothetical protein
MNICADCTTSYAAENTVYSFPLSVGVKHCELICGVTDVI